MTPNEFKAWLQGIDTVLGGASPNAELWKLIREAADKMVVPQPFVMPSPPPAPSIWDFTCSAAVLGELKGDRDAR